MKTYRAERDVFFIGGMEFPCLNLKMLGYAINQGTSDTVRNGIGSRYQVPLGKKFDLRGVRIITGTDSAQVKFYACENADTTGNRIHFLGEAWDMTLDSFVEKEIPIPSGTFEIPEGYYIACEVSGGTVQLYFFGYEVEL